MNDNMTTATHMFDHSKKLAEAYEKVMQPLCKRRYSCNEEKSPLRQ